MLRELHGLVVRYDRGELLGESKSELCVSCVLENCKKILVSISSSILHILYVTLLRVSGVVGSVSLRFLPP